MYTYIGTREYIEKMALLGANERASSLLAQCTMSIMNENFVRSHFYNQVFNLSPKYEGIYLTIYLKIYFEEEW